MPKHPGRRRFPPPAAVLETVQTKSGVVPSSSGTTPFAAFQQLVFYLACLSTLLFCLVFSRPDFSFSAIFALSSGRFDRQFVLYPHRSLSFVLRPA